MVAKCGRLVTWHWAHRSADCDPWSEPESAWHLTTKLALEALGCQIEVRLDDAECGWHVADAVTPNGGVIELQASSLDVDTIAERESFYGLMCWVWQAHWADRLHHGERGFWWKNGARSVAACSRPMFWAVDDEIWRVSLHVKEWREWLGFDRVNGKEVEMFSDIVHRRVLGKVLDRHASLESIVGLVDVPAF
jgi:hypothetical protein